MHLREAVRLGGLVALALLAACEGTATTRLPEDPAAIRDPGKLRALYRELEARTDAEAALARARICARLRDLENPGSAHFLACGDGADLQVIAGAAAPADKAEAAARLFGHFRERAAREELCRSAFPGPLGAELRRLSMLAVARRLGEYLPHADLARVQREAAEAAARLASASELRPESAAAWRRRAELLEGQARERALVTTPPEPSAEARKFCETEPARHLEEATRASALATREKADRGDPEKVVDGYLRALEHYVIARECLAQPTQPQEDGLAAMAIVVENLHALLARGP